MRTIRVLVNAMLAIVLSMGLALSAAPGEVRAAATYTVCPGGTCDFTTIQAAIDAAASATRSVAAGTIHHQPVDDDLRFGRNYQSG